MPVKFGIGIATYNRCESLRTCISQVRQLTPESFPLVVADDGSTDETVSVCADENILCVRGPNMGIAWNKNRALFFLHRILDCDVVILLEDDCHPNDPGWHRRWIDAATKWGHINFGGDWLRGYFVSGSGDVHDPFVATVVSGQCSAFTRRALSICGFFDSRFKNYGYEHAEHTRRFVQSGFGGEMRPAGEGKVQYYFYLLADNFTMLHVPSYHDEQSMTSNWAAWEKMYRDPIYRQPWRTRAEFDQFRREIDAATRQLDLKLSRRLGLAAKWARWGSQLRAC